MVAKGITPLQRVELKTKQHWLPKRVMRVYDAKGRMTRTQHDIVAAWSYYDDMADGS